MAHQRVTIDIIETSDVHGHVLPHHYGTKEPLPSGMAKISSYVKKARTACGNLLLLDNGDMIQGTPLTFHYAHFRQHLPNPMISIMNYMGYDGATIGNHEFNFGKPHLSKAISQSFFPWLSANILHHVTKESYFGFPFFIKEIEGVKVAVLGLTTHYIPNWEKPSHIEELEFEDALQSLRRWVSYIQDMEHPDLLIVSYHGGLERDPDTGEPTEANTGENQAYAMCEQVSGIDVLLTGHQHRKLAQHVQNTFVLQPGYHGEHVGHVTVTMSKRDGSWMVEEIGGKVVCVRDEEADREIIDLIHYQELETQRWLDQPLGEIQGGMKVEDPMEARITEHPLVEWINRVQMEAAGVNISATSLFTNEAKGFERHVTMREIVANYIYPNTLAVIKLSKEEIKEALELAASYFELNEEGEIDVNPSFLYPKAKHYNYDMWEGVHYTIDVTKPAGQRITEMTVQDEPDDQGEYEVVLSNYRAAGGGEYSLFKGKKVVREVLTDMSELLARDLITKKVMEATVNHNWRVVAPRYAEKD